MDDKSGKGRGGGAAKAMKFLVGKGFYIVLFLCLAAIGISGYVILFRNRTSVDPGIADVGGLGLSATVALPGGTGGPAEGPAPAASTSGREVPAASGTRITVRTLPTGQTGRSEPPGTTEPPAPEETTRRTATKIFYVRPLAGEVLRLYSGDVPVQSPTMGDWRIHTGLDIAAPVGTEVCSVAAGTVTRIYRDDFKGVCVEAENDDGVTVAYCGLLENVLVSVGDRLSAGTPVGGVGETALFEVLDEAHLHLEMKRDGAYLDPSDLLPGSAN